MVYIYIYIKLIWWLICWRPRRNQFDHLLSLWRSHCATLADLDLEVGKSWGTPWKPWGKYGKIWEHGMENGMEMGVGTNMFFDTCELSCGPLFWRRTWWDPNRACSHWATASHRLPGRWWGGLRWCRDLVRHVWSMGIPYFVGIFPYIGLRNRPKLNRPYIW